MMKRGQFFVLFFCLLCAVTGAQETDPVFLHPQKDSENSRFKEVCAALSSREICRGNFVQEKTIAKLKRSLVSRGTFVIASRFGVIWKTETPFPSVSAVGRDFIVQQTSHGKKQTLSASGNETFLKISETISAVFSGNSDRLFDNFAVYFSEENSEWTVGLVPSDAAVRQMITDIVMTGGFVINEISIREKNNDSIRYRFSNWTFQKELTEDEKSFFSAE
jgi:outer membrane lipoprotein-sorting protein